MKRHYGTFSLFSLLFSVLLAACGGGGGDTSSDRAFPAWNKGGSIVFGEDSITVKFDLSRGHLLGMATKDANDHNPDESKRKDDPTRIIKPEEVEEVEFISGLVGWDNSLARAPFDQSGTTVLPNTAHADKGYFRIILKKTGERVAFAISEKESRWDVTGTSIVVTSDGALQYGDYRLGKITFFKDRLVLRIDFGANVLGGLSRFVKPTEVVRFQWVSELMNWYDSPAVGELQIDERGDYFVEIREMPNNDKGWVKVWVDGDTTIPSVGLNSRSPRWEQKDTADITLL